MPRRFKADGNEYKEGTRPYDYYGKQVEKFIKEEPEFSHLLRTHSQKPGFMLSNYEAARIRKQNRTEQLQRLTELTTRQTRKDSFKAKATVYKIEQLKKQLGHFD